ncbi:MAG: hypothetical protein AABW83_02545 [Nanoarchaeota archaeon]
MNNFYIKDKKLFNQENRKKSREIIYSLNFNISNHFSGACPPEIFVGRYNYPNVNAGILSPNFFENSEELSMPEIWYKKNFNIGDILMRRSKLIYGRFKTEIKSSNKNKFSELMQEIAMSSKPISTEIFLKRNPKKYLEINKYSPVITNFAPLDNLKINENIKIDKKVDYLVSDIHSKSNDAVIELYKSGIAVSNINKILSAGLLGIKINRKLVPTRWAITAVDDNIGKELINNIKYYKELDEFLLFHSEYVGNHYEILLIPGNFSFEIIEADVKFNDVKFWQDYESFHGRKNYAKEVVGGYYVARLAVSEYLERIKRQANILVLREITNKYYAHLGVGILRETCRDAFNKIPEKFTNLKEAFDKMQERLNLNVEVFKDKSLLLNDYGKQKKLFDF